VNLYVTLLFLAVVGLLQSTLAPYLALGRVKPDLMLVVVVAWGVLRGAGEGVLWGCIGGLYLDLLSGGPFGVSIVSLILASYLTGVGEINLFRTNLLLPVLTVILATIIYYLVSFLLLQTLGRPVPLDSSMIQITGIAIVLNVALAAVLYQPLRWLSRITGQVQMTW